MEIKAHLQMQWVVNGISVTNISVKTGGNEPQNLKDRIILGVVFVNTRPALPWYSEGFDLTDLNIYSSALSIETMLDFTKRGNKNTILRDFDKNCEFPLIHFLHC